MSKGGLSHESVQFTPLTVFIGNNGSGKSSLIEGLETLKFIVEHGLDRAMQQWHGFEHIWNQGVSHKLQEPKEGRPYYWNPMGFDLRGKIGHKPFSATMEMSVGPGGNELFIRR